MITSRSTKGSGPTGQIQPGPGAKMPPLQIPPSQPSPFSEPPPIATLRKLTRESIFQKLRSIVSKGWDQELGRLLKVPKEAFGYDEAEISSGGMQRTLYFVKNPEDQVRPILDALMFGIESKIKPKYLLAIYPRGSSTYIVLIDSERHLTVSMNFGSYQEPEDKRRNWKDFKVKIKESLQDK